MKILSIDIGIKNLAYVILECHVNDKKVNDTDSALKAKKAYSKEDADRIKIKQELLKLIKQDLLEA